MLTRWLSLAGLVVASAACTNGIETGPGTAPDGGATGGDPQATVTYQGKIASVLPVPFGGPPTTVCTYTQSVENLVLDLLIRDGVVIGGAMQDHNVEVVTNPDACPNPAAAPSDVSYTFTAATAGADATTITFAGAPDNHPQAALTVQLTPAGATYNAALTIARTDLPDTTYEWTVTTSVQLAPKR